MTARNMMLPPRCPHSGAALPDIPPQYRSMHCPRCGRQFTLWRATRETGKFPTHATRPGSVAG